MGRAIFSYEMTDPDFSWLLTSFGENRPEFVAVDIPGLPIYFLRVGDSVKVESQTIGTIPPPTKAGPNAECPEDEADGA